MATLGTILVCDDEELIRWSMAEHLRGEGYRVVEAEDGEVALERLATESPDLVITDLKMPRVDGMELLRRMRELDREVPVIVITAHGAVETAVQATQLGARHYITKPFDLREVSLAVAKVLSHYRLQSEVRLLRTRATVGYDKLLGQSAPMQRLYATLARLESIDAPTVLIHGESGTGKDLVARAIHNRGPRRDNAFMEVDCASLPEALIESELFGHEKGSFTDARSTKRGQFEVARGGSIFLDEIGEMSPGTQAKLLRALENRTFKRVGGVQNIQLDAGIIAASNKDLAREVKEGRFREDLFFRLNVVRIDTPPLRERREDIAPLVHHFITRFNREFRKEVTGISAEATVMLDRYRWPGNVRELRNVIERTVILEADTVIEAHHLPGEIRYGDTSGRLVDGATFLLPEQGVDLEAVERSFIVQAIDRTDGNQSAAARLLGISRYALRYRLEKFGLAGADDNGE